MQLRQRISTFATLKPLTRLETADYIEHRLKVAGYQNSTSLFTLEVVSLIAHYGEGIPRNINNICFNSLSFACAQGKKVIDTKLVREAIACLGMEGPRFAEPTDDLGWQGERSLNRRSVRERERVTRVRWGGEPTDDLSVRENESTAGVQGARFAEPTDDLGWQRTRFAEPVRDSEPDEYEFEESDLSERGEASFGLRIALIAALLFATALAIAGWNFSRSPGPHFPLMSHLTSWLNNYPPEKNQPAVQAPALPQAPTSSQVDQSAQTSIRRHDESVAQAATPAQDDSSLQSAVTSETKPANDAAAQTPPVLQVSKPNHKRSGANLRASRTTIPNGGVEVIGARQGQSFAGICVERFNGCTTALLNTIAELNPGIKDHDHLKAGQRIILPRKNN